jgi:hypothetical protein
MPIAARVHEPYGFACSRSPACSGSLPPAATATPLLEEAQTILPLKVPLGAPQTTSLNGPKPPLTSGPARRTEPQTFYQHSQYPKEVTG